MDSMQKWDECGNKAAEYDGWTKINNERLGSMNEKDVWWHFWFYA